MEFIFFPNEGVNNLRFGMGRSEIRNILTKEKLSKEFYRSKQSKNSCDAFYSLGIIVNYDEANECEAFEFIQPAELMFNNNDLMKLSYIEFTDFVGYIDKDMEEDDSGCTSLMLGIGAYAPFKNEDPAIKVESIIVFKKGYYD